MTRFYEVGDNTSYTRGVPEIGEIFVGLNNDGECPKCGVSRREPAGDLQVSLYTKRAEFWPDAIACGDYPCFVVSENFVNAMRGRGVRLELGGKVEFVMADKGGLSLEDAPAYFWIDGNKHFAATMDFESSGFVDVRFCEICGTRSDNIGLTYDRQHADPAPPTVFNYNASSGLDLFTTDLAPTAFFSTDRAFNCAKHHKLTNLAFRHVESCVFAKPL
jgi:hypothetical protein